MKKVLLFGTFDTIHPGHLFILQEARKYGEVHAVLALDATVKQVKGRPPVHSLNERIQQLGKLDVKAYPGDPHDRLTVFKKIKPDYVLLGYDQTLFVDTLHEYITENGISTEIVQLPSFHADLFKSSKIRTASEDKNAGFLLIDKPSGEPSMRTVIALRKITGIKQIGFAGTLDPLASGLLICGIGSATKLLDWFHLLPKTYEAIAKLGITSDTYDSEGKLTEERHSEPTKEELQKVLDLFVGDIEQEPPMYSAKKVKGKKLYELARKGLSVKRKKANVTIHSLELVSYEYPKVRFKVTCSTGTYVRSLIHDVGKELRTGAHMTALQRTAIGSFSVEQAIPVSDLSAERWRDHLLLVDELRLLISQDLLTKA